MLESKTISHIGNVRERNEDFCGQNTDLGFWILADGVGGNGNGHVASEIAVQSADRSLRQGGSVIDAVEAANTAIVTSSKQNSELAGMASTIVVCVFDEECYEISWIGDSRAYVIGADRQYCLTKDHNLASERGIDTRQAHHQLTQALGFMTVERPPCVSGVLGPGENLLICSDGLSGVLDEEYVFEQVLSIRDINELSDMLLNKTLAEGAPDNVSFTLIRNSSEETDLSAVDDQVVEDEEETFRACFDKKDYARKSHSRPYLLLIIMISIVFLIFFL